MERRVYVFEGNVQGVGFRYTAANLALQYDVKGYVRNLPDGRVELVAEGPPRDLDSLLEDIAHKMQGLIRNTHMRREPPTGEFDRFCIRH